MRRPPPGSRNADPLGLRPSKPSAQKALPQSDGLIHPGRGPSTEALGTIAEVGGIQGADPSLARRNAPPWESAAVRDFASRLHDPAERGTQGALSAMVLEGPKGVLLQAVGEDADHKVAGQTVADIQKRNKAPSAPRGLDHRPPTPPRDRKGKASSSELARKSAGDAQEEQVAFGAVYEHRDSAGKPRLIGSTSRMPERQLELDWRQNEDVRKLATENKGGSQAGLVWVGVGRGPVGQAEMAEVRRAVVDKRSERLRIEKLSGIKPYSAHT